MITEEIDRAVREGDVARLTDLVRSQILSAEARDYLAKAILGLLSGDIKRPNHRPKQQATESRAKELAYQVVRLHRYKPEWAKLTATVKKVAEDNGCSPSKVWSALRDHRIYWTVKLEEWEFDEMLDAAYEAEWNDAVEHLKEEHGDREFSDEEVRDEIEEQRQAYYDFIPSHSN